MPTAPLHARVAPVVGPVVDPYALARRTAVPALIVVVAQAIVASTIAIVPALSALHPAGAAWMAVAAPLLLASFALAVLLARTRGALAALAWIVVATTAGATVAGLAALSPSLRGVGLAFAAPLVVGEVLAAGAWIASRVRGEKASAVLSLAGAATVTCAAAFLIEHIDVDIAPLAVAVGGVLAQLQLAAARVGEARASLAGADAIGVATARIAGVPRVLLVATLGRSGPQEDA